MGLATDRVDTPEQVLPAATAIAERIAARPHPGEQGTERTFNRLAAQNFKATLGLGPLLESDGFRAPEFFDVIRTMRAPAEKKS